VPIRDWADCNNPQQFSENFDHVTDSQCKGIAEIDENTPIGQVFSVLMRGMPPLVGPTLAWLGNVRTSVLRRPY
jgi:hypothetical protein